MTPVPYSSASTIRLPTLRRGFATSDQTGIVVDEEDNDGGTDRRDGGQDGGLSTGCLSTAGLAWLAIGCVLAADLLDWIGLVTNRAMPKPMIAARATRPRTYAPTRWASQIRVSRLQLADEWSLPYWQGNEALPSTPSSRNRMYAQSISADTWMIAASPAADS